MACADPENFPDGGAGGDTIENFGLFSLIYYVNWKSLNFSWVIGGGGSGPRLSRSA